MRYVAAAILLFGFYCGVISLNFCIGFGGLLLFALFYDAVSPSMLQRMEADRDMGLNVKRIADSIK